MTFHAAIALRATKPASLSILLVDDDPLVRETMGWLLTDAGHEVHEAADGVDALAHLVSAGPVDLLITDINMPRMDGLALAREAKARWPELPVLLVSGRPQPPGTEPYLAKPFPWNTLIAAVSRAIPASPMPRMSL